MQPDAEASFADLNLRPELVKALSDLGYEEPTPIQRESIPPLLEGRDLVGQAATGTGKTAAFALPLLQRMPEGARGKAPVALIMAPTRELAVQVAEAVKKYGTDLGARVLAVYGGQPIGSQLKELQRGVDVVVGTPGRLLDHLNRGSLKLDDLQVVVLDEADEMFDMGFAEDIEAILATCPTERQTVLFSATMPPKIDRMSRRHLRNPVRIAIERTAAVAGEAPKTTQHAHIVARMNKPAALGRILDLHSPSAAIVFCRTREEVDELSEALKARGYRAEPLHGGMSQDQRDRVMNRLRNQTADLLIATDVAARGLDVDHLTHVINYNVPSAPESYVHRIGRVGRAGREGVAITLAEPREQRMLQAIERVTGVRIPIEKLPSVADLNARRLDETRTALVDILEAGELDAVRAVVTELSENYDVLQIALAATTLAHRSTTPGDQVEIPDGNIPRAERTYRDEPSRGASASGSTYKNKTERASNPRSSSDRPARPPLGRDGPPPRKAPSAGKAKLYIGAGKQAGVRPQDLVGAIAGETELVGRDIGGIEITERFSLVEVPESAIEDVIRALRSSVIKGRKVIIRRDRDS